MACSGTGLSGMLQTPSLLIVSLYHAELQKTEMFRI